MDGQNVVKGHLARSGTETFQWKRGTKKPLQINSKEGGFRGGRK